MIQLKQLNKIYQHQHAPFYALKNISLEIRAGESLAITGPSGSGKSTLMHMIGLLDRPTSGEYLLRNSSTTDLSANELAQLRNRTTGFVFQSFFLLPRMDVLHNVMLPLFYRSEAESIAREKSIQMLEKVGMKNFISQRPNQLSGGQQQRVAIARALVGAPDIILADEPTGALDSTNGKLIMDMLLTLNREENKTLIIVTHDPSISRLFPRVIQIRDGEMS
ncbi:MAG: ABC transporter ATP-binding protein [Gammaproteobacteria bacterium]|nr:ABC transporter ATP-binding protein [Gammaproteobacteria bacterium]